MELVGSRVQHEGAGWVRWGGKGAGEYRHGHGGGGQTRKQGAAAGCGHNVGGEEEGEPLRRQHCPLDHPRGHWGRRARGAVRGRLAEAGGARRVGLAGGGVQPGGTEDLRPRRPPGVGSVAARYRLRGVASGAVGAEGTPSVLGH